MFTLKKTLSIVSMAVLFLVACTPEDGDTGPAGPVGPEGPIGPAGQGDPGQDGQDGVDGRDGVANISVQTFIVDSALWMGTLPKMHTEAIAGITQEVVDNGTVQVFQTQTTGNTTWDALPFGYLVNLGPAGIQQVTIQYSYELGNVNISVTNTGGFNITTSNNFPGTRTFKVVVIPPAAKIDGFEPKTFEELQMVYGLKD